jgi:N-acylneuraminate cytidylyltransferase
MKVVAIIPIKKKSERIKGKNFKLIKNKPLFHYILEKVIKCKFDEVYVDSDSNVVKKYCKKNKIRFIERKKYLSRRNSNGNDLLNYHSRLIEADLYFQVFVTAPLLSIKTINNCIKILKNSKLNDSILTVNKIYSWFWFNKKPVNYDPRVLPRSQDAMPIIQETTGLYGIKKKALIKRKCRIGYKPIFYQIPYSESIDLDNLKDFEILKKYL